MTAIIRVLMCSGALVFQTCAPIAPLADQPSRCCAAAPSADPLEEVLWWLPADTETAMIIRKPYQVQTEMGPPQDLSDWYGMNRPLVVLNEGNYTRQLEGQTVQLAITAMRRFRSPKGLGEGTWEGCGIFLFAADLGEVGDSLMQDLLRDAPVTLEVEGVKVARFKKRLEQDTWTHFLARPRPDVLIEATDRASLEEVLSRMKNRPATRALPADLPEWRHLDSEADFWAIRHFDRDAGIDDPAHPLEIDVTSPFCSRIQVGFDPSAIGLCFSAPRKGDKVATVLYLSGSEHALEATRPTWMEHWADLAPGVESEVKELQPGIIQITHPIDSDGAASRFRYMLFFHLGIVLIV